MNSVNNILGVLSRSVLEVLLESVNILTSPNKNYIDINTIISWTDIFERTFFDFIIWKFVLLHTFAVNILVRSFTTIDRV